MRDRIGRKKMLIVTMTIMGSASVLIGLLPPPAQIGALAPVLLGLLRETRDVDLAEVAPEPAASTGGLPSDRLYLDTRRSDAGPAEPAPPG